MNYKTMLVNLLMVIVLAACSSAPAPTVAPVVAILPDHNPAGLVGQAIFINATLSAFEATVAVVTESARLTEVANGETATAGAALSTQQSAESTAQTDRITLALTGGAATQQWRETQLAFSVTEAAATESPKQTAAAVVATATAQATGETNRANSDRVYWWLWLIVFVVASATGLYYFARTARAVSNKIVPANDPNQVRVLRLPAGTLILTPMPSGGVHREFLALPAMATSDDFDTDEEPAEDIPIYAGGMLKQFFSQDSIDTAAQAAQASRARALKFLRKCIEINGPESNLVPGHRPMKMGGGQWQRGIATLGANVQTIPGVGTKLVGEWATLAELYSAVGERRARLNVIEHSPAPTTAERV